MGDYLFIATLIVVALVVLVLVVYLVGVIMYLFRAAAHLQALAGGLQKIETDTAPLAEKLTTINGALDQLHGGLSSVNTHLGAIAKVLKL
jgi:predicted membrane channel-forming protein YqfA (hemolysin III family)